MKIILFYLSLQLLNPLMAMKILFLNLPSEILVVRRYMCSSFAETFLFPPHDLVALAGAARSIPGVQVFFLDAVAERKNLHAVIHQIQSCGPDIVVSIISFELYEQDVLTVKKLKERFPEKTFVLFGHYPTHFPEDTLHYSGADMIMLGEPDEILLNVLSRLQKGEHPDNVDGVATRKELNMIRVNGNKMRVPHPEALPLPAYDLLVSELYSEPFMPRPFGLIQTARGCPYQCNYCVHSFGTKLTALSPEKVFEHILLLKRLHGIRALRFIDDTFTVNPARVIEICRLIIENKINIQWTCLARADTLNEEMLGWMKRAGCVRLNIGMESGSQHILDFLNKGIRVEKALDQLKNVRKTGMEMMGFFLTGVPGETEKDIQESVDFAHDAGFHYVVVDTLKVYPGTPLFNKVSELVDFSLLPYRNEFKDPAFVRMARNHRSLFYRKFYFSLRYLHRTPIKNILRPRQIKHGIQYVKSKVSA
ncbi:MAG: B12-binding domain-containing radical SAM protein [Chitinophagales bacterium]|nr:MAG: B12-binding domain-containing radical SAM protein [Chitinophagales bacterium]